MSQWFQLVETQLGDRWHLDEPMGPAPHDDFAFWAFTSGQPIDVNAFQGFESVVSIPGPSLDWTFAAFNIPILNAIATTTIRGLVQSEAQFVPVKVISSKQLLQGDYEILVLRNSIACFDWETSEYDLQTHYPGKPKSIGMVGPNWYVDPKLIPKGVNILYVAEWPAAMIVSSLVRERIQSAGLTGVDFIPRTLRAK